MRLRGFNRNGQLRINPRRTVLQSIRAAEHEAHIPYGDQRLPLQPGEATYSSPEHTQARKRATTRKGRKEQVEQNEKEGRGRRGGRRRKGE